MSTTRRSTRNHASRSKSANTLAFPAVKSSNTINQNKKPAFRSKSARRVRVGNNFVPGEALGLLRDSSSLLEQKNFKALRSRLHEEGVLLLRNAIPMDTALSARKRIIEYVVEKDALDTASDESIFKAKMKRTKNIFKDGWTVDAQTGGVVGGLDDDVEGWSEIGNSDELVSVYDGPDLHGLLKNMFGSVLTQPHNTWIRLKGKGDVTIEHADYYYFKRNTMMISSEKDENSPILNNASCAACDEALEVRNKTILCKLCHRSFHLSCIDKDALIDIENCFHCQTCADSEIPFYTCWISLSEIDLHNSSLAFIPQTHKLTGFDRPLKDKQTPREFVSTKPSSVWNVAARPIGPGDIFIFNIKTIHAATRNNSAFFRLSIDTRFRAE